MRVASIRRAAHGHRYQRVQHVACRQDRSTRHVREIMISARPLDREG